MTTPGQQEAPVAQLGGKSDEGQKSTTIKEQIMQDLTPSAAVPTRLELDGLVVDVDPSNTPMEHVEITFSTRWSDQEPRTTYGIAFTPAEACKLAEALLDGVAPQFGVAPIEEVEEHARIARKAPWADSPEDIDEHPRSEISIEVPVSDLAAGTVSDIFRFAQEHDMGAGEVMQVVENYIDEMAEAESLTPAKWCRRRRREQQNNR